MKKPVRAVLLVLPALAGENRDADRFRPAALDVLAPLGRRSMKED